MIYDMDDIDRARRTAFEQQWAAQHGIPVDDLDRLGYVAIPIFKGAELRPRWEEMMTRGPCVAELLVKLDTP